MGRASVSSRLPTIEELKISNRTSRPASTQPLEPRSNDAPDPLTKEHVPMLQQFFTL